MADMANKLSINPFIYDQLSFLEYDCNRPRLDTEWLLSTLFDASLLSTSKAADSFGGSFFATIPAAFGRLRDRAGNHKSCCGWTPGTGRAMICSS
ncbi:hypothetical protein JQ628_14845 [Bradyrhizobium lablabi]|uniref:hypothetical protein n=1 Tax=Bradyrhizobium lablabi TaxID=722472 RepID=UPI001BA9F3A6|nr:hypothetical protein [Bradyrhizobium lablabi]MBR1122803.1 hypothetical protein [Bradyrhizobium lablabi]